MRMAAAGAAPGRTCAGVMKILSLIRPLVALLLLLAGQGASLASASGLTCARRADGAAAGMSADVRAAAETPRPDAPLPDGHDAAPEAPASSAAAGCAPALPASVPPRPASGSASAAPLPAHFLPPIRLLADSQFRPPRLS